MKKGLDTFSGKKAKGLATESAKHSRQLVMGKEVRLVKDVSEVDQYGRLLRYVYFENGFINLMILKEGYATAVTFPPDVAKIDLFIAVEKKAKLEKKGLWGSACFQ